MSTGEMSDGSIVTMSSLTARKSLYFLGQISLHAYRPNDYTRLPHWRCFHQLIHRFTPWQRSGRDGGAIISKNLSALLWFKLLQHAEQAFGGTGRGEAFMGWIALEWGAEGGLDSAGM